jgi:hypothetical protein
VCDPAFGIAACDRAAGGYGDRRRNELTQTALAGPETRDWGFNTPGCSAAAGVGALRRRGVRDGRSVEEDAMRRFLGLSIAAVVVVALAVGSAGGDGG